MHTAALPAAGKARSPLVALQALGELPRSGRQPDTAPGPALAGIPAGSWGAARCSRRSGEPLGDSPTCPATGQGPFLPQLSPGAAPQPSGYRLAAGAAEHETQAWLGNSQREQSMPAPC